MPLDDVICELRDELVLATRSGQLERAEAHEAASHAGHHRSGLHGGVAVVKPACADLRRV